MIAGGWKRGNPENYDRALALYPEDVVGFVKDTQPEQWEKFCTLYPSNPEQKFLERVGEQLCQRATRHGARASTLPTEGKGVPLLPQRATTLPRPIDG